MKNIYAFLFFILIAVNANAQSESTKSLSRWHNGPVSTDRTAFLYSFTKETADYADLTDSISLNNGEIWDDPEYTIPVNFPFFYMGVEIDFLVLADIGGILYGYSDTNIDFAAVISPFYADLVDRGSLGATSLSPISYKVIGEPGNQILIIEWKNAGSYEELNNMGTVDMNTSFQTWLYESNNVIAFHYGPHLITNPNLFYYNDPGAIIGLAAIELTTFETTDVHLLEGQAANPMLVDLEVPITGTPAANTRYVFTPIMSSTNDPGAGVALSVSPNPTSDILRIAVDESILESTILNLAGTPIWSSTAMSSGQDISVAGLPMGMYLLKVRTARGTQIVKWAKM
ncbi:MAG: T9SS type A sorting domain-containing protein [Saprospiraceae bacterium]|nr:T9SS type A sorting domain-containing protein [Saprospiraceae bacterium]